MLEMKGPYLPAPLPLAAPAPAPLSAPGPAAGCAAAAASARLPSAYATMGSTSCILQAAAQARGKGGAEAAW